MCTVSMIMDHYHDKWEDKLKWQPMPWLPTTIWPAPSPPVIPAITKEEIDEFHKLLDRARKYDIEHGEPDCELQSKKDKLKELAAQLGVDITFPGEQ